MIDPRFVFFGMLISLSGSVLYIRDTLRGETQPNRVTWTLWGLEPLLAFGVERQAHIGLASVMTLVLGLVPIAVVAASFRNPHAVWKIGRFDVACGVISAVGLVVWVSTDQPTVALISFVVADAVAALPTVRKSYLEPETESAWAFLSGAIFAGITLLTLTQFTTAGALFPMSVLCMNTFIWLLIVSRAGPRLRSTRGQRSKVATA